MNIFKKVVYISILFNCCFDIIAMEQQQNKPSLYLKKMEENLWTQRMQQKIQKKNGLLEGLYGILLKYINLDLVVNQDIYNITTGCQENRAILDELKKKFPYKPLKFNDFPYILHVPIVPQIFTIIGFKTILLLFQDNNFAEFVKNRYNSVLQKKDDNINNSDNNLLFQMKMLKFLLEEKDFIEENIKSIDYFNILNDADLELNKHDANNHAKINRLNLEMLCDLMSFMRIEGEGVNWYLFIECKNIFRNLALQYFLKEQVLCGGIQQNLSQLYLYEEISKNILKKDLNDEKTMSGEKKEGQDNGGGGDFMKKIKHIEYEREKRFCNKGKIMLAQLLLLQQAGVFDDFANIITIKKFFSLDL